MCCPCCSVRQQKIWVFSIGALLTVLGIVLVAAWPSISRIIVNGLIQMAPNTYLYKNWVTTPVPVYTTFYLFNWTNSEEFNNTNVKPHFEELGPYTFSDYKVKEDLIWDDAAHEVTYYGRRIFQFLPDLSNGTLEDIVISPHIPTVTASSFASQTPRILRKIINFGVNREGGKRISKYSAGEWIFFGFYDHLLDFAERLHSPLMPINTNKIAWFLGRNDSKTAEGSFTIDTGKGVRTQMGELRKWNGNKHTGYYEGECGRVNGSTGELWAPGRTWHDPVSVFLKDAARFINIFPQQNVTVSGIDAWLYTTTERTFDNGQLVPDTKCFCVPKRNCPLNGVIDYSPAAFEAPIYMSHSHFYMADAAYRANITGLQPDATKHGIRVLIEPTLGIPIDVVGQVMISMLVERNEDIDLLKDLAWNFYAPLFTVHMRATLPKDKRRSLKLVLNASKIGVIVGIVLLCLGVVMLLIAVILTRMHKWRGDTPAEPKTTKHLEADIGKDSL